MTRWLAGRNRGQELVEYALTLPILLLFVLGIMEFGVTIFAYNSIANAAREGARVGAVASLDDWPDPVVEAVIGRTGGLTLTESDVQVDLVDKNEDPDLDRDLVRVTVGYSHQLITGLIVQAVGGDANVQLRSVATMYREN